MSPRFHVTADWPNVSAADERDAMNQCFWAVADNNVSLLPAWTVEAIEPEEDDEHAR